MKRKYLLATTLLLLGAGAWHWQSSTSCNSRLTYLEQPPPQMSCPHPKAGGEAWNRSSLLDRQGQTALNQKRYQEAEGLFRKALLVQPHNPEPRLLLAEACERQGKLEEALQAYYYTRLCA